MRAIAQALHKNGKTTNGQHNGARENIVMIGATHAASHYIKLLDAYSNNERRVIALLDGRPKFVGRSMSGIPVLADPIQLNSVIEEFVVHGIKTDRVIIDDDENLITDEVLNEIKRVCEVRAINLDFLGGLIGLDKLPPASIETVSQSEDISAPDFEVPRYFTYRSVLDFTAALIIIVLLLPLLVISAVLVLLDIGSPVLFWQQRMAKVVADFCRKNFVRCIRHTTGTADPFLLEKNCL